MKVQNKKKFSYVIIGNPSFLLSGGVAPPIKEGKPPFALWFSNTGIITIIGMGCNLKILDLQAFPQDTHLLLLVERALICFEAPADNPFFSCVIPGVSGAGKLLSSNTTESKLFVSVYQTS